MSLSLLAILFSGQFVLAAEVTVNEGVVPAYTAIHRVQVIDTRITIIDISTGRFVDLCVHEERIVETVPAIVLDAATLLNVRLTSRGLEFVHMAAVAMETYDGDVYVFISQRFVGFLPWRVRNDAIGPCPRCGQFHGPASRVPATLPTYLQV